MQITIDMKDNKLLERVLRDIGKKALPFATKNTLNSAAFDARIGTQKNIEKKMILRNKFTVGSIRVVTVKQRRIATQKAITGSIASFMDDQEDGGVKRKKGKTGTPIPTAFSARQEGRRTKLPLPSNRIKKIVLRNRKGKNKKQKNLIAVREASRSKNKHVFLDTGRRKGIYKVIGGKRKPKVRMVHDLSRTSVTIPPNPTLDPAVQNTRKKMAGFFNRDLQFQLDRIKSLKA